MQPFDAHWNYSNPEETESYFRSLLPTAVQEADPNYYPELLTQIGRTLSLQQKFAEAHAILDKAQTLLSDETKAAKIRYFLERGRSYNSDNQTQKGIIEFEQALRLAQEINAEFYAVDAAHMLAIATNGEQSLQWHLKAIQLADQATEERARRWRGSLYNNMGWTYHDMSRYDDALHMFEQALQARKEQGDEEAIRIAHWCIGRVYRSLGRVDEALAIHKQQLAEYEANEEESGYTYEEIAECLWVQGSKKEARPYFAKAYSFLSKDIWLVKNESDRLSRLNTLGTQ